MAAKDKTPAKGIRLSDVMARVKVTDADYEGEQFAFGFYPGKFTVDASAAVGAAMEREDMDGMVAGILPLVAWWDVLDDEDQRIPVTTETLGGMPLGLIIAMFTAMGQAMNPQGSKN